MAKRLDKTEDLASGARADKEQEAGTSLHLGLVVVIAEVNARKHHSRARSSWNPARQSSARRAHSQDRLVGPGQLGTATCGSSGGGLELCRMGKLKTELSCLLGVSGPAGPAVEESHHGDWSSCQGTA